jgi:hypothetical protein
MPYQINYQQSGSPIIVSYPDGELQPIDPHPERYIASVLARATAQRIQQAQQNASQPGWYDIPEIQINPTQQETPMTVETTPTPVPTVKHEAMIILHVRYDMLTQDEWSANNAAERMAHFMVEQLRTSNYNNPELTIQNTMSDYKLTYSGINQYKTAIASEHRRRPNVWLTGRLESMTEALSNWANSWRAVRSNNSLYDTCRHLDTDGRDNGHVMLPMLPHATMRRVIDEARTNMDMARNDDFANAVRQSAITMMDGLFEDGLPITHVNTRVEPF